MGYYPMPPRVVELLRDILEFPEAPFAALDPCCGTGEALALPLRGTQARTYGVEIHVGRYEQARGVLHRAALGAFEGSRVAMESFSLAFVNPPYDWRRATARRPASARSELPVVVPDTSTRRRDPRVHHPAGFAALHDMLARHLDKVALMRFPDDEFSGSAKW